MSVPDAIPRLQTRSHAGRKLRTLVSGITVLAALALAAYGLSTRPQLRWDVVLQFLFSPAILGGVLTTVELTVISQLLAIALGIVVALLQRSANPVTSGCARLYIWFFRAVPLLVQLIFWYNVAILIPEVRLRVPLIGLGLHASTNEVISGFTAAILGLGLHEAAYMAEIIRSGLISVPQGQVDAALTIGLTRGQAVRRIVLPQALRVIIPPAGNQFVGLLKASALVSAIGGGDLLTRAELIYGQNYLIIPLLTVATIWYLVLVSVFSVLQHVIEARLSTWTTTG